MADPRDRMPDHGSTLASAADVGARHLKAAMDDVRGQARRSDDFDPERPEQIRGGGQSRESFVLSMNELATAYGYLRAVADMDKR